jgi:pimeloyl-ACP methyl ester carboxylesterase
VSKNQQRDDVTRNLIFLHGLESSSQAYKASLIRKSYPELIVPDFAGPLEARMEALYPILGDKKNWTIVGSSFGGLMGAIYTCEHPDQVKKLVMLAPALMLPQFASFLDCKPVSVSTTIIHGTRDRIVSLETVREIAQQVFANLTYKIVDDDHALHKTAETLDWKTILS